jgi:hypothetical protein
MREHVELLIFLCRQRMVELDTELSALAEEIRDYNRILAASSKTELVPAASKAINRWLGLSPSWLAILARLARYKHFRASDMVLVSRELHKQNDAIKEQNLNNARYQLSAYTKKGLIQRLGGANYRVAEKCRTSLELLQAEKASHIVDQGQLKIWARAGGSGPRTAGDAR